MLDLHMMPAREGDALWIRWGEGDASHQLLVDMGTAATGKEIRARLEALDPDKRVFELLVVTHVDRDHIAGVVRGLIREDPLPGLTFKDIWFNGWDHLHGRVAPGAPKLESWGPADGERFGAWLRDKPWNQVVGRRAICWDVENEAPVRHELPGGLFLTVLGPTPTTLREFVGEWSKEVKKAFSKGKLDEVKDGIESYGSDVKPVLTGPLSLRKLAERDANETDTSKANASSIALLLEYKGTRIVLAGDAHADELRRALLKLGSGKPLEIDAFKVPHHGSAKNLSKELIDSVTCPNWLISTDGTRFKHPDAGAIARILQYSTHKTTNLHFNAPSTYNGWWASEDWRTRFGYSFEVGSSEDGLTVSFS